MVRYTSGTWNITKLIHNTIKKKILSIVLCISKFQDDILNQEFLRINDKPVNSILQKDVKNITFKHIFFYIYQAILSNFNLQIKYIKGYHSSSPNFLTREICRIHETMTLKKNTQVPNTQAPKLPESQSSKTSKEPSPHEMLWSQQVELEEKARLHSSDHMPNKMLSLYYDHSDSSKPVKAT